MPDPMINVGRELWDGLKYVFVAVLTFFGWTARRQIKRVDKIEDNYVDKETFNNTLKAIREDLNTGVNKISNEVGTIRADVGGVHRRIDNLADREK